MASASTFALPAILFVLVQLGLRLAFDELPHPAASRFERHDGPSLASESDDLRVRVSRLGIDSGFILGVRSARFVMGDAY
ncbi:hypothetical protein MLD38_010045 [Melastoma candidum]|uniref:Uncharacterized protein n=1 Tax=Melastoma candidum TaxID=119954 RepID=A0ACB9QYM7_9MYRT|nr:hypothetical protein MLD38_010045 [Melastoma candidum]